MAVRIQEVFGLRETPRIAGGCVPVLLAPNMRPQQVTDDLQSFWENTYPAIRKELRGRYPRHAWPDDPRPAPAAPAEAAHVGDWSLVIGDLSARATNYQSPITPKPGFPHKRVRRSAV